MQDYAFSDVNIDVMGGNLPRTQSGNKYLLVILCNVSKFVHAIRGLLYVMRENWERGDPAQKQLKMPTEKYMQQLSETISSALETAHRNSTVAQQRMKRQYDKHTPQR